MKQRASPADAQILEHRLARLGRSRLAGARSVRAEHGQNDLILGYCARQVILYLAPRLCVLSKDFFTVSADSPLPRLDAQIRRTWLIRSSRSFDGSTTGQ